MRLFFPFILLVLLLGCLGSGGPSRYEVDIEYPQNIEDCNSLPNDNWKADCYQKLALTKDDINYCKRAAETGHINDWECYLWMAQRDKSIEPCLKIDNKVDRNDCIASYSVSSENGILCNLIGDSIRRGICKSYVAVRTNNRSVCENMVGESDHVFNGTFLEDYFNVVCKAGNQDCTYDVGNDCLRQVNDFWNEVDGCENTISDSAYDNCISRQAGLVDSAELCKRIKGQKEKDMCLSMNSPKTIYSSRVSECSLIEDQSSAYFCARDFAIIFDDLSLCDQVPKVRDMCYSEWGKVYNELETCKKVVDLKEKSDCIRQVSISTSNLTLCSIIPEEYTLYDCIEYFGVKNKNADVCDVVENQTLREGCKRVVKAEISRS